MKLKFTIPILLVLGAVFLGTFSLGAVTNARAAIGPEQITVAPSTPIIVPGTPIVIIPETGDDTAFQTLMLFGLLALLVVIVLLVVYVSMSRSNPPPGPPPQ